jgi:hypothetical protein
VSLPVPRLFLRRNAVDRGWSDSELARLARSGELSRIRRGAYVDGPLPADDAARHRMLVSATLAGLRRTSVVSHQSAAVLHGMPLWGARLDRVHITRRPPAWNDNSRLLFCHVARLRDDEIVEVDGVPVTDPVRTALDLSRSLPYEAAVVVLDLALHGKVFEHNTLRLRLADIAGARGARAAARAVGFADKRSESVGESRSRLVLHQLGLPPSSLQFPVMDGDSLLGRSDFAWEEEGLLGEFDGRVKYGRLLRPGQDPGDAVFEEKRREDAFRDLGYGMVRWVWSEVGQPDRLGARVHRGLERGRR